MTPCNGLYVKNSAHNKAKRNLSLDCEIRFLVFRLCCCTSLKIRLRSCSLLQEGVYSSNFNYLKQNTKGCQIWQYGLRSFQTGGTKLERFLLKDQHTQRNFLNFENWTNGEVSKSAKSPNLPTFKVNFLHQKLSRSFSFFFH